MKNVIKNILLLCFTLSIGNLGAMNSKYDVTLEKSQRIKPTKFLAPLKTAGAVDEKYVASSYDAFFEACMRNDADAVKDLLINNKLTFYQIEKMFEILTDGKIKTFLAQVITFLTINNVQLVERILHSNKRTVKYGFVFLRLIPLRFQSAVEFGHVEMVNHLLKKYSGQLTDKFIKKMFLKLVDIIIIKSQEDKPAYITISQRLLEELSQRHAERSKTAEQKEEQIIKKINALTFNTVQRV